MKHINDNNKNTSFDDPAWDIMRDNPNEYASFERVLRSRCASEFIKKDQREIDSFLWFVQFDYYFTQEEIKRKREQIGIVK